MCCKSANPSIPALNKFLMLYSLRSGAMLIMVWLTIRSLACLTFVILAIPELFTGGKTSFDKYILTVEITRPETIEREHYLVYSAFVVFLVTETILFVHSLYLAHGLFCRHLDSVRNFLVSRGFTTFFEIATIVTLCFIHKIVLGWYLLMLMIFILELYSFEVVYSYFYNEATQERQQQKSVLAEWQPAEPPCAYSTLPCAYPPPPRAYPPPPGARPC